MTDAVTNVTILGDSRVFDTYFTNAEYSARYGYNSTFPHILRKRVLSRTPGIYDIIHIPDHFRGGTTETNNIRLALTDPGVVILCDGIWETLVHKDWFIEWAVARIRSHPTHSLKPLDLTYSSRRLADLFITNELSVSPKKYAEKQRRIISYFRRRRRQCVWMSLPMPPRDHLDRMHFAGNYRCIPEWDECLRAINLAMEPVVTAYHAIWFDLHDLVLAHGGFDKALIDQWHFSASFHNHIADELYRLLDNELAAFRIEPQHASRKFLLAREALDEPLALFGSASQITTWLRQNPLASVEAVLTTAPTEGPVEGLRRLSLGKASSVQARCVIALQGASLSLEEECSLLDALSWEHIVLYPEELRPIENPGGKDRAEVGQLR